MEGRSVCLFKGLSHSVYQKGWTSERTAWPKHRQASPHPVPGYCDSCSEVPGRAYPGSGVSGLPQKQGTFALGAAAMGDVAWELPPGSPCRGTAPSHPASELPGQRWPGGNAAGERCQTTASFCLYSLLFPFLWSLQELAVSQLRTAMPGCCGTTKDNSAPAGGMKWALGFLKLAELCCQKQRACKSPGGIHVSETAAFSIFLIKKNILGGNNTEIAKYLRPSHVSIKVGGRFATDF